MSYTADVTESLRLSEADAYGVGARTVEHRVATVRVVGATQQQSQLVVLSAGLTDQALTLSPVSTAQLLWLQSDQAVDLRLNALSASRLSGVQSLVLAGVVSGVYVTTGSATTVMRVLVAAGGSLVVSIPNP